MGALTYEKAKKFAQEKFKQLSDLELQWNILHAEYMIKAIDELSGFFKKTDIKRLKTLAWVHDIGKIKADIRNHAQASVDILEQEFKLEEKDKDCILNHGTGGKPETEDGRLFKYAEGLSLHYPETILFRYWAEGAEKKSFEETKENIQKIYEKYIKSYSDFPEIVKIINEKYRRFEL
ncbi:HD domain-containing protein [Candidatus Woesearchaeota archaeon]|nr:HD domain-containing protein [Candidatus Woesearchaeota archaeon]